MLKTQQHMTFTYQQNHINSYVEAMNNVNYQWLQQYREKIINANYKWLQIQKKNKAYLIFSSNFAPVLLSLMSSTQRVYTHKILTPIAEKTTTAQETQIHVGTSPYASPLA